MKRWLKRISGMALCIVFLVSLSVSALAEVCDLAEALNLVGQGYDRIEISDDFSGYRWNYTDPVPYSYNDGKIVILWREAPLKKFEKLKDPIADDYTGKDIGEAKTYLCAELMEQIPEELRATTPEEVDSIILIETEVVLSGVITSYKNSSNYTFTQADIEKMLAGESLPLWVQLELMSQSRPDGYKPVFATIAVVSVFNKETGGSVTINLDAFDHEEMRSNPEAADIWEKMGYYSDFLDEFAMVDGKIEVTEEEMDRNLENIATVSQEDYELYSALREQSRVFPEIPQALSERYWEMAKELVDKENDTAVKATLRRAIDEENRSVFGTVVNMQSYAGVSISDAEIIRELYYIGRPTPERMEEMLQEVIDLLDEYLDWNLYHLEMLNDLWQTMLQ